MKANQNPLREMSDRLSSPTVRFLVQCRSMKRRRLLIKRSKNILSVDSKIDFSLPHMHTLSLKSLGFLYFFECQIRFGQRCLISSRPGMSGIEGA